MKPSVYSAYRRFNLVENGDGRREYLAGAGKGKYITADIETWTQMSKWKLDGFKQGGPIPSSCEVDFEGRRVRRRRGSRYGKK